MAKLTMVMNTENIGVSQWGSLDFNSLCVFNGVMYAASDVGVYAYGGSNPVTAYFQTASVDFASPNSKRVIALGLSGYYTGGMAADVILNGTSVMSVSLPPADSEDDGTLVFEVNGTSSGRFVGVKISNVNGADFSIKFIDADIVEVVQPHTTKRVSGRFSCGISFSLDGEISESSV